jgi:hypothetical protein
MAAAGLAATTMMAVFSERFPVKQLVSLLFFAGEKFFCKNFAIRIIYDVADRKRKIFCKLLQKMLG